MDSNVSYTEKDIREALPAGNYFTAPAVINRLRAQEKKRQDIHVHDFADTDTITVGEFKAACKRTPVLWDGSPVTVGNLSLTDHILRSISEHREPEYKPGTVWEDAFGVAWYRGQSNTWMRFGVTTVWNNNTPKRPLRQMIKVPF